VIRHLWLPVVCFVALNMAVCQLPSLAQQPDKKEVLPHHQTKPPGPALSPTEAVKAMTVPKGFQVQVVSSEPNLVNPVSMCFDERGRVWVTESLEYPRRSPGVGRDRIKILEDTNHDGTMDKVTVFAEGLNIPSGIAVGHGGVWVANAPDLLFLQDTDGDDKADKSEVVVTGFGRDDTHELPNSLTWGPDGYLYGLNGVFNPSRIEQDGKVFEFTCALFRIDPRTKKFELFCEGTSNPWGVAFDNLGSAFISACVIDHLWHLTETGYYHRQGGPYPPFTWKINSIVKHKHQMAAYCGIVYFDTNSYPAEYRDILFMGNIHGNCINADRLQRAGSTYFGTPADDFLTANDAWFMPVAQKVGPDGYLYILDWYDRYHCYQDANRDPQGIDRAKGRLYRVCYGPPGKVPVINLGAESSENLLAMLSHGNVFYRETAQRILAERRDSTSIAPLQKMVSDTTRPQKFRLTALWSLISQGPLDDKFHQLLLQDKDPTIVAWAIRAAGNQKTVSLEIRQAIEAMITTDTNPDVLLQIAIAAPKIDQADSLLWLVHIAAVAKNDGLLPQILWQNIHPFIPSKSERILELIEAKDISKSPVLSELVPRISEKMLAENE
jgi:putative membrane-bound dehydrogenase-like protein